MGMNVRRSVRSLALACLVVLLGCGPGDAGAPPAPAGSDPQPPGPPGDVGAAPALVVAFRLDPSITGSVYMGERWVTPETFTVIHSGEVVSVQARAHVDVPGGRLDVSARWTSADPEMLAAPTGDAHQVELTVRRVGQTTLAVSDGQRSTTLTVTATQDGGRWRVDVSR